MCRRARARPLFRDRLPPSGRDVNSSNKLSFSNSLQRRYTVQNWKLTRTAIKRSFCVKTMVEIWNEKNVEFLRGESAKSASSCTWQEKFGRSYACACLPGACVPAYHRACMPACACVRTCVRVRVRVSPQPNRSGGWRAGMVHLNF